MIKIWQAVVGDVDFIGNILEKALGNQPELSRIKSVVHSGEHNIWIAIYHELVVGFLDQFYTLSVTGIRRAEIDLIGVLPDYQGQGIGRQLIKHSIKHILETDTQVIRALIATDNVASQRAFALNGFMLVSDIAALYVSGESRSLPAQPRAQAHYMPVSTLTYDGIWIEHATSRADLEQGKYLATQSNLDIAGITLPISQKDLISEIEAVASFRKIGLYQWWVLERNLP